MLIEKHITDLNAVLAMTPCEDEQHGELTLTTVTKMTMVLPSKETGELAAEAKGEAYMAALEDVPSWAVQEAMRRWHRKECGPRYEYIWQPGPSTLREVAMMEAYRVMAVRRKLNELLTAETLIEFSEDHRAVMRAKIEATSPLRRMDA